MTKQVLPRVRESRIAAYGICISEGRMLVIHKAHGPYAGMVDLPGGGIEWGEAPEDAVVREVAEETGLAVTAGTVAGAYSRVSAFDLGDTWLDLHHMAFLYNVKLATHEASLKIIRDGGDSLGAEWVPLTDLTPDRISPRVARALELA